MPRRLSLFPAQPDLVQTVTLGGVQYRLTFTYRSRTRSWYCDIATVAGVDVALGCRLSPGWTLLYGRVIDSDVWVGGDLYCFGPEPYQQADLGDALQLWYYSADELATITAPAASGLTVVVS